MALTNTDVFIVADTGGTNYKLTYSDLLTKLQSDISGGGMGNALRIYGYTGGPTVTTGLNVPGTNQSVTYNGTANDPNGGTSYTLNWRTGNSGVNALIWPAFNITANTFDLLYAGYNWSATDIEVLYA